MPFLVPSVVHNRGVKRSAPGGRRPIPQPQIGVKKPKVTRKPIVNMKRESRKDELPLLMNQEYDDHEEVVRLYNCIKSNVVQCAQSGVKQEEGVKGEREMTRSEKLSYWHAIMDRITAIFDRRYDRLIRYDCGTVGANTAPTTQMLTYLVSTLHEKHQFDPIEADWIRWAISKLLLSLSVKIVYDKMGPAICEQLRTLVGMLSKTETCELMQAIADQMFDLTQQKRTISLTRPSASPDLHCEINLELRNGRDLMRTLIELLVHSTHFDLPSLPVKSQLQLWSSIFHMLNIRSPTVQLAAVQLMHRLISLELASVEIVRCAIEYAVAILKLFAPTKKEESIVRDVRDSTVDIIQLLSEHLRKLGTSRLLRGVQGTVLIGWAVGVLGVAQAWNVDAVGADKKATVQTHKNQLRTFSLICCRVLFSIRVDAAAHLKTPMKELEAAVKCLITAFLKEWTSSASSLRGSTTTPAAATAAAEERMASAIKLLLYADTLNGSKQNSEWFEKETDATLASCGDLVDAALRARHLIISSLAPKREARRGSVAEGEQSSPTTTSSQQSQEGGATAAAAAAAATPSTTALLRRLLPDTQQIMQYIESVGTLPPERGTAVLQALFSLVARMIPLSPSMAATAIAVLSLPWMVTEPEIANQFKRHKSLPLLKDLFQIRNVVKNVCSASSLLRECTLGPLASLPRPAQFHEWRWKIFEKALVLHPSRSAPSRESLAIVNAALNSLADFVASVEPTAYDKTLAPVMELVDMQDLARAPVHIEHVMRALADSLCAFDGVSRRWHEAKGEYECVACTKLMRDGVPAARPVNLPKEFGELLVKVFSDDSIRGNNLETRIVAYSILFALLCHVQDAIKRFEKAVIASLALMSDKDADMRGEYELTFKLIVALNPSPNLIAEIKNAFEIGVQSVDTAEEEERKIQRSYESSAPFLAFCASEGHDASFRQWSREKMYERALNFPSSQTLPKLACELHVSEAGKLLEIDECPRRFFVRQIRKLSSMLSVELFNVVHDAWAQKEQYEEAEWIGEVNGSIDFVLQTAATIWGFDCIASLLRACASHLVADCFVKEAESHGGAIMIMDRLRAHLVRDRRSFIEECVPTIVEHIIPLSAASRTATNLARDYLGISMRDLLDVRRYHCTLFALRMLSENVDKASRLLNSINRTDGSLTAVLKIRCEYLGYLLSLRRALLEDESYDLRGTILRSIRSMITLLEELFLDEIAPKLMMVLRAATAVGEEAVEVWTAFVERLGNGALVSLLPQILIAVQPLLRFESSSGLLSTIFEQRDALGNEQSAAFERAVMVLLGGEGSFDDDDGSRRIRKYLNKRRMPPASAEDVILGCARMLLDEGETVGRVVLRRLDSTLDGHPLRDDVAAAIMPALLHTIRVCADADVRLAASKCIGMVGAVDPGRLGLSLEEQRREGKGVEAGGGQKKTLFLNSSNKEFYVDLLVRAWRVYASLTDADMIDIASFGIQSLLSRLVGVNDEFAVFKRLPDDCRRDIAPFLKTSLTNTNELKPIDVAQGSALVCAVNSFADWLLENFLKGMVEIKNAELHEIFKALKWIVYTRDTTFARHLLPHIIIIMVMERREVMIEHYGCEMIEVLRRTIDPHSPSWIRLAAHVIFSVVDILERYAISKSEANKKDSDYERVTGLIKRVCSEKLADGNLLVVVAAEKCQCLLRALRWCEQFAIGGGVTGFGPSDGAEDFDRVPFYGLERLYMQLNDVDGVAGAFETIARNTSPTADERILALEANGDYTEALPLYAQSGEQKELKLLESLLRLNQPQLALSTAAMEQRGVVYDASTTRAIEAAQLEAAWHLRDWSRLDDMIKRRDPLTAGETGWGAACASIMSTIQHRKEDAITFKIDRARANVVEGLTALTIEDSDTYAQSYKYIAQLHMLAEIDDAKVQLLSDDSQVSVERVNNIMKYWEERSESVTQCASTIEPILRVRRELLRVAGGERGETTKDGVCGLLLQSCRLARQAGHLQIAWTFLVEAKALETCHQGVCMEEARFEFQKGNQSEAIGLLTRLLSTRFSKMHEIFTVFTKQLSPGSSSQPISLATQSSSSLPTARSLLSVEEQKLTARALIKQQRREDKAAYAEVQLLRTEFMLKAGASAPQDLYSTYMGLTSLNVPSEDLHYRVAVFCDGLLNMTDIRTELITEIVKSYAEVLKCGRSHLFHAVPRMLTIWLDVTQKWAEEARSYTPASSDYEKRSKDIRTLNETMKNSFNLLPLSVFFPAFPQLISRILHPDKAVFEELSAMLARLIVAFPHQCLWQAIAVYRDKPNDSEDKHSEKMKKCMQVFERAKVMDKTKKLGGLIDQYDFFARQLISIAEDEKMRDVSEKLISKHFMPLHNFFKGKMDTRLLLGATTRKMQGMRTITPHIMIPITEMLEQSISEEDVKMSTFSQFIVDESPLSAARDVPVVEPVYIKDVVDEFVVMSSLMAPRKISLRGTDGKIYGILCKKNDELRKDARLISFCKMMNCLMRRTPEARRRQLMVRTFSAIPLQSKGGIIEWVPNLKTFKETLKPLYTEYADKRLLPNNKKADSYNDNWSPEKKLTMMRDYFYRCYPQVAAEWQRRAFSDPCSWHCARLLFTRSCAVMSMIGFVCGLGDRHADNILIDQTDGGLMHVDFNILFNAGERLKVPEIVPFRLTRNLVDGFGPTGAEGTWRKSAEVTLEVMRANAETLLTVMQTFIYDPLVEFGEARAQQNKQLHKKVGVAEKKSNSMVDEVLEMIKNRLEGHIVTPRNKKKTLLTKKMSVSGQVAKLYELATDEEALSQMFSGWSPFL